MINTEIEQHMGKGRGKFKKRYKTTREGPTKSQQEKIERIVNPRTPADLLEALQTPSSPAHQQMMNLIAANREIIAVFNILVDRFLTEQHQAEQKEKDEVFKAMLAQELAQQKDFRQYYELQAKAASAPPVLEEEKLKEKLVERSLLIQTLKNDIQQINKDITRLDERSTENSKQWEDTISRHRDEFLQKMEDNNIHFMTSDGEVIDQDHPKYQEFAKPAVLDIKKLVDVLCEPHELHQAELEKNNQAVKQPVERDVKEDVDKNAGEAAVQTDKEKSIPRPPAPPPMPKRALTADHIANQIANMHGVMEQLKNMARARKSDTTQDLLKAIEENKAYNAFLAKNAKERMAEVKEIRAIVKETVEIRDEKKEKQTELKEKEIEVKREEVLEKAEKKVYEEKFGKFEDKKDTSLASAPSTQKSSGRSK